MTQAMLRQLAAYVSRHGKTGEYWGNRTQFWARHRNIELWIEKELKRLGDYPIRRGR